ncbi:stimulus-sensing domain-containing protein [Zavarzinia sp. CC-PAN008]|uniref:sensor histidine kinase n=1 Tax=Zavarzinia sp. CC-PAN008 TaxID=3243332 RepID=UPI003F7429F7
MSPTGPEAGERRRRARVTLTRRILAVNLLPLALLVGAVLYLDQYRAGLIQERLESLSLQARIIAGALGEAATTDDEATELSIPAARLILGRLAEPTGSRAQIFDSGGTRIADSQRDVIRLPLPPPEEAMGLSSIFEWLYDLVLPLVPDFRDRPLALENGRAVAADYVEVVGALAGNPAGMERVTETGTPVLSYAVPVQRVRKVVGALLLSSVATDIDEAVRDQRLAIVEVFVGAMALTAALSLFLASTIARPVRRLAAAAEAVRLRRNRRVAIPDFSTRGDEIGDLSRALRAMTDELYARIDATERFAADVAHELKNPLSSIGSAVELLDRIQDPEKQAVLRRVVRDDVRRLDRLITDISEASRLDAELSRDEATAIDLLALAESLASYERARGEDRPGAPVVGTQALDAGPFIVRGVESRLGQVVRNLIDNAVSFSPPGGAIRLLLERQGPDVVLTVEDEGPGIPEEALERVFERFYSERPSAEGFGNHSGLGLSIVRQILAAGGGAIRAENRLDGEGRVLGARFVVHLPAIA